MEYVAAEVSVAFLTFEQSSMSAYKLGYSYPVIS